MLTDRSVRKLAPTELFLLKTPDDTEDASWMVIPEYQWNIVNLLMSSLRLHITRTGAPWYIAAELLVSAPIRPGGGLLSVAPDLLVAVADGHERVSWKVVEEGQAPAFVLEVVTKESMERDLEEKPGIYDALGVREYAVFAPRRADGGPVLSGYRREADKIFAPWIAESNTLSSTVLGLDLVIQDARWLRLRDRAGVLLPSIEEAAAAARARADAEADRADAEADRADTEAQRADEAESELARLHALLRQHGLSPS